VRTLSDVHGHAKGEHQPFARERPIVYTPRMLLLWFWHTAMREYPKSITVTDHANYLTSADPAAVATARRALDLARESDVGEAARLGGIDATQAATLGRALRRGMQFNIGLEADDDPRTTPEAGAILAEMQPDLVIRSVHFLPIEHPETGELWQWPFDNPEFADVFDLVGTEATWDIYMTKLIAELETHRCDVAGHFYVPAKFGHWPAMAKLDEHEDRYLDACLRRNAAVEFNTRVLYREQSEEIRSTYRSAHRRLLRKAKAIGVRIVLGSDAHAPGDQGRGFDVALELINECGIETA
jgi:histidinol-phosphatase (PHP family)